MYGIYAKKYKNAAHTAAKLAFEKKTLNKKDSVTVDRVKDSKKTHTNKASECSNTLPT